MGLLDQSRFDLLDLREHETQTRGDKEAVWGLGIRGIHDRGMQGPDNVPTRIGILHDVFRDQVAAIDKNVSPKWGPVAKCFVPYKEVLPLYDAGVEVPDDATLVWVDDNFGYIRRLSNPKEHQRGGGRVLASLLLRRAARVPLDQHHATRG